MRYDEDKIFGAYMDSLLVEKKKGLPPWLKKDSKKDEEKDDDGKAGKKDKKPSKKGKKGLPPWLKNKKNLKEAVEAVGSENEDAYSKAASAIIEALESVAATDQNVNRLVSIISQIWSDNYDTCRDEFDNPEGGSTEETEEEEGAPGDEGNEHVKNMERSEPSAAPNAERSTARYMQ